jgi:hypothetical protein
MATVRSTYNLIVRGESVRVQFKRINDSRRLDTCETRKNPNLFGVRSALKCSIDVPKALVAEFWKEWCDKYGYGKVTYRGEAFCTWRDKWNSQHGRHSALAEALRWDHNMDESLAEEIKAAFIAEEARRAPKPKGPSQQPRKPKAPRVGMRQLLTRLCDLLEKANNPLISIQPMPCIYGHAVPAGSAPVRPADEGKG